MPDSFNIGTRIDLESLKQAITEINSSTEKPTTDTACPPSSYGYPTTCSPSIAPTPIPTTSPVAAPPPVSGPAVLELNNEVKANPPKKSPGGASQKSPGEAPTIFSRVLVSGLPQLTAADIIVYEKSLFDLYDRYKVLREQKVESVRITSNSTIPDDTLENDGYYSLNYAAIIRGICDSSACGAEFAANLTSKLVSNETTIIFQELVVLNGQNCTSCNFPRDNVTNFFSEISADSIKVTFDPVTASPSTSHPTNNPTAKSSKKTKKSKTGTQPTMEPNTSSPTTNPTAKASKRKYLMQ